MSTMPADKITRRCRLGAGQHRPATAPAGRIGAKSPSISSLTADPLAITTWLQQLGAGQGGSVDQLFAARYSELRRNALAQMRKESAGHTLSATALTHDAWFRLSEQTRPQWAGRSHFLGMASIMMRRILVNHAVARQAVKRDVALVSLALTEAQQVGTEAPREVVMVHDALLAFEQVDPRAAKVVALKFFGGLETDEIAELMGLSSATVKRDWALARAWLHRALDNGALTLPGGAGGLG